MSLRQLLRKWTTLAITLLLLLQLAIETQGQSCLSELLSEEDVLTESTGCKTEPCALDNEEFVTRLIPAMNFTCSGKIVKWRAAGRLPTLLTLVDGNTMLRIWRVATKQAGLYVRTELAIELGKCGENQTVRTVGGNVYECELSELADFPVQAGDIVGLDIPRSRRRVFQLYFNSTQGPHNYEFQLASSNESVSLSDAVKIEQALPLLSLTVVPDYSLATTSNDGNLIVTMATTDNTTNNSNMFPTVDFNFRSNTENNTNLNNSNSSVWTNIKTMTAILVGLCLMPAIIIVLILALVCSIRKNRKLKRKMTRKQLSDGLNSSIEVILSESRDTSETSSSTGTIPMEENVAYSKRKKSDGYEYVVNELVYASIDECDKQPEAIFGSPHTYLTILDPANMEDES